MFKNEFQGGSHFEVFSAQGKDPIQHWKLTGTSGIKKEFDKSVKSYVFALDGSAATTKIQLPKDPRQTLALVQRYLVMQLFVPKGADFSVDLGIQDLTGSKRRLHFSTAIRETSTTPLHSKVPLALINRDLWCNLCIDLANFVGETWTGQTYKSIESLCLSANCRLRRIFTLRTQPPDTTNDEELYGPTDTNTGELEGIPRQCQLAPDIPQVTQVLNYVKILHFEGKKRPLPEIVLDTSTAGSVLDASGSISGRHPDGYHIAFGTKVPGKKSASRDGATSGRAGKSYSGRSRSDSNADLPPTSRQPGSHSAGHSDPHNKHLRTALIRDRKNSDPGTNQEDPDMSIDRASLRTSHTWTDGADQGKSGIPFVKPHPPREPRETSADHIHRKPRVKSAGKERSSAGRERTSAGKERTSSEREPSGSAGKERTSAGSERSSAGKERSSTGKDRYSRVSTTIDEGTSSVNSSASSQRSLGVGDRLHQPTVFANEEELDQIMANMQESTRRGLQKPEETEDSEPNSNNTSGCGEDSLDEVINTLKTTGLSAAREYIDTDEDEEAEDDEEEQVFLYSSKPKSAPRHKKIRKTSQRFNKHKSHTSVSVTGPPKARNTSEESDFVRAGSSEEEESIMTRVLKHKPSPRVSPCTPSNGAVGHQQHHNDALSKRLNGHEEAPRSGPPPQATSRHSLKDYPGVRSSLRSPQSQLHTDKSPIGSQSRMSIRKKSLREIPKDDVRLSQQSKPYSPDKYTMDDLSESYEAAMLQSLRRQTLEEGVAESDEEHNKQPHRHSHLHYSDHSLSDSNSDTDNSRSTLQMRQMAKQKVHNYADEMKSDFLNHSNPRDWGNVFSPPIVFPSQKSAALITSDTLQVPLQAEYGARNHQLPGSRDQETDEEDELDLLYDPVLNCYFDPKTCKYYELV